MESGYQALPGESGNSRKLLCLLIIVVIFIILGRAYRLEGVERDFEVIT